MTNSRIVLHTYSLRHDELARRIGLRVRPQFPVPEQFGSKYRFNAIHNLDNSKIRAVPQRWYIGLDYIYLTYYALGQGLFSMANNKNNSTMPEIEFIQFKLNSDEAKEFNIWLEEHGKNYEAYFRDILIDDHKVSLSFDARNDCFICSLTGKGDKNPNTGKTMLSRSEDEREAFMLAYYKHHIIFKKRAWKDRGSNDSWG